MVHTLHIHFQNYFAVYKLIWIINLFNANTCRSILNICYKYPLSACMDYCFDEFKWGLLNVNWKNHLAYKSKWKLLQTVAHILKMFTILSSENFLINFLSSKGAILLFFRDNYPQNLCNSRLFSRRQCGINLNFSQMSWQS